MDILLSIIGVIIIMLVIVVVRTITFKSKIQTSQIEKASIHVDKERIANKLSEAIKVKTVSSSDYEQVDWVEFNKYIDLINDLFPLVHKKLEKTVINEYSLLYKWSGENKGRKPILMTAHYDVVPVDEEAWDHPPFSGTIINNYVWGRGTLDTKVTMITALEAVELLLEKNYKPDRDIYFAFGHDEEVGGTQGAIKISTYLKKNGIELDYIMDEGSCVIEGAINGITKPMGVIGVGEKGYANIELSIKSNSGHASMPPRNTALGQLAKLICRLEKYQCKIRFTETVKMFLSCIGPEMKGFNKIVLANLWLFKPLFISIFSNTFSGNAMLRTTTAVTMAKGSLEPNVLPSMASCVVNFRIALGETKESLLHHIEKLSKDLDVKINPLRLEEASAVSPVDTEGYQLIESTIHTLFGPSVITAPYIVLAATDSRKYEKVCQNIYRFSPYQITTKEMGTIHSNNERISINNLQKCVDFYMTLYMN